MDVEMELRKAGERTVSQYEGLLLKVTLTTGETVMALAQHGKLFELERVHEEFIVDNHEFMLAYVSSWPLPDMVLPKEENNYLALDLKKIRPVCKVLVENNLPYLPDAIVDLGTRPHYLIITKIKG